MRFKSQCGSSGAYALLMVLVMVSVAITLIAATMTRTANVGSLNERHNQYVISLNAAEAATEKVIARMRYDYSIGNDSAIVRNLDIYRTSVPTGGENPYWTNFIFTDASLANRTYVQCISNQVYVPLQSQYYGLSGWRTVYRVLSNARQVNGRFNITNAVQQDVEMDSIPVFQFAIFYNSLLEFTWAAPLTVRGRVHANGNIFVGSAWPLIFNATVTDTGIIAKTNWGGHTLGDYTGTITYNGNPSYATNVPVLQLPIGTNNTPAAVREIINMPPPSEDVNTSLGQQRYYNKAKIILLVSNSIVTAIVKNSPSDASPVVLTSSTNSAALSTNFPFLTVANTFTDQREGKTIKTTQIDIGKFNRWVITNKTISGSSGKFPPGSGVWPNILYVADNRTTTGSQLSGVRLTNSVTIPTNGNTGFTLATPNPLYVLGNYNCPNSAGTTNTSGTQPSSLVSDALTILSSTWKDSLSSGSFTSRKAVSTTINAALLTGVVYSGGTGGNSPFSGGVVNLPRMLEDWGNGSSSVVLTINTSMVNFFNSVKATAPFQNPGVYYYAPTRNFNFDLNFTDATKLPPGTPMLGVILRASWANPPANTTSYYVNESRIY